MDGLPALFSSAWLVEGQLVVPAGPAEVVFDLQGRKARGPGPDGLPVEVDLNKLATFAIRHRELAAGTDKTEHIYTVELSDGQKTLLLTEIAREYAQHQETQEEYGRVLRAIHALPGLLGVAAEMDHPQHAPKDPQAAYSKKASATFQPRRQVSKNHSGWTWGLVGAALLVAAWWVWRRR